MPSRIASVLPNRITRISPSGGSSRRHCASTSMPFMPSRVPRTTSRMKKCMKAGAWSGWTSTSACCGACASRLRERRSSAPCWDASPAPTCSSPPTGCGTSPIRCDSPAASWRRSRRRLVRSSNWVRSRSCSGSRGSVPLTMRSTGCGCRRRARTARPGLRSSTASPGSMSLAHRSTGAASTRRTRARAFRCRRTPSRADATGSPRTPWSAVRAMRSRCAPPKTHVRLASTRSRGGRSHCLPRRHRRRMPFADGRSWTTNSVPGPHWRGSSNATARPQRFCLPDP